MRGCIGAGTMECLTTMAHHKSHLFLALPVYSWDREGRTPIRGQAIGSSIALDVPVLLQVRWRRVVLDEAHSIKDRRCSTARAVFALTSKYKWALSGTPLQVQPPRWAFLPPVHVFVNTTQYLFKAFWSSESCAHTAECACM